MANEDLWYAWTLWAGQTHDIDPKICERQYSIHSMCVFASCWTPHGQGTCFKYLLNMRSSCSYMIVFVFPNLYQFNINVVWSWRVISTQGLNLISSFIFTFLFSFLPLITNTQIVPIKLLQHKCNCRHGYIHKSSSLSWNHLAYGHHTHPDT